MKYKLRKFWIKNFIIDEGADKKNKFIRFSMSIFFGLVFGMIFLSIVGFNPFVIIFKAFSNVGNSETSLRNSLVSFAIMGMAGLSAIISFRASIFNIGIAGQMMMGGSTAVLVAILLGDSFPKGLGQIIVILISSTIGALVAFISIILKILFKISEVVSTILINWIGFFYSKWLFNPTHTSFLTQSKIQSKIIGDNFALQVDGNAVPVIVPLFIFLAIVAFIILYKMKWGYEVKLVGLNPDASKYAGINVNKKMIVSMITSGAIAGLLGVFIYFGQNNGFIVPKNDTIPSEGFDGIAIALIAFSNPLLIMPVALLFTTLSSGIVTLQSSYSLINPSFVNFMTGIIMYAAAISIIFIKIKPIRYLKKIIYGKEWENHNNKYREEKEKIDRVYFEKYSLIPKYIGIKYGKIWKIRYPMLSMIPKKQKIKICKERNLLIDKHLNEIKKITIKYKKSILRRKEYAHDHIK